MQWLDDPPRNWEAAPEDPPAATDRELSADVQSDGLLVHDPETRGAFIYAKENELVEEPA